MIAGFGFKISSVPFQFWAPDVYEGAPTPITAFLSVASKAAGFAVILRLFYISFPFELFSENWAAIFAILSIASMTFGNLVAIRQNNIKRMLAYSTIAHAGYVMVGLAAFAARAQGVNTDAMDAGPSAVLFYLGGYVATNLLVFGAVIAVSNSINSDEIDDYGGLSRRAPMLAAGMAFAMISLTGIPPTIGFMSKVYLFGAAVNANLEWACRRGHGKQRHIRLLLPAGGQGDVPARAFGRQAARVRHRNRRGPGGYCRGYLRIWRISRPTDRPGEVRGRRSRRVRDLLCPS